MMAMSKFLIPKATLSKWTASMSFTSITKKGYSVMAMRQFFTVALIFTADFFGQPMNQMCSIGMSNSIGYGHLRDWLSTIFEN